MSPLQKSVFMTFIVFETKKKPVGKDNIITVRCLFRWQVEAKLYPLRPQISVSRRINDDLIQYTPESDFSNHFYGIYYLILFILCFL